MAYKYRIIRVLGKTPISVIVVIDGRTKVVSRGQTNFPALVAAIENGAPDDEVQALLDNKGIIERILLSSENFLNDNEVEVMSEPSVPEGYIPCVACDRDGSACPVCAALGYVRDEPVDAPIPWTDTPAPVTAAPTPVADAATVITKADAWTLSGEQVTGGGRALVSKTTGHNIFISKGLVHVNGIPLDNELTELLLRHVADGNKQDIGPLAMFLSRVVRNPAPRSRTELFQFLKANKYTIAPDGRFYAFKGVEKGRRLSFHAGKENVTVVYADGTEEAFRGRIPHPDGATIKMSRGEVDDNSGVACGRGLHIGSEGYVGANYKSDKGIILLTLVDPEHVVAVPSEGNRGKMRTSQLEVVRRASKGIPKKGCIQL